MMLSLTRTFDPNANLYLMFSLNLRIGSFLIVRLFGEATGSLVSALLNDHYLTYFLILIFDD